MPSLPNKSIKGAAFKKWVVESIDKLIDYLSSTYIQVGQGLKIRRSPSGLVIELEKQAAEPQSATGGGGMIQDISSAVTGGTATISLSGSTSSVEIVGGTSGNVAISENSDGQIEIDVQGTTSSASIGFPDYESVVLDIDSNYINAFPFNEEYTYPVWITGSARFTPTQDIQGLELTIYPDTPSASVTFTMAYCDYGSNWSTADNSFSSRFDLPIPANTPFRIKISSGCIEPSEYRYRVFKCLS